MNMKVIVAAAILFCTALIGIAVYASLNQSADTGPRKVALAAAYTKRLEDKGWVKGSEAPKVKWVVYGDYECPACYAQEPNISQAYEATKDIAQFTFRNYPLPQHNKSHAAAYAAEAAGRQGKFWEMHDILYANQTSWANESPAQFAVTADNMAKQLNIDLDQFHKDQKDQSLIDTVSDDVAAGNKDKVQGTPTILINDIPLSRLPSTPDELIQIIKTAAGA